MLFIFSGILTAAREKNYSMSNEDTAPDHIVDGEAKDQETILRQRPTIEEYIADTIGPIERTKLYWNMTDRGTFEFALHFWFTEQQND